MKIEYRYKTTTGESGNVKVTEWSKDFEKAQQQAKEIVAKNYRINPNQVHVEIFIFIEK